MNSEASVYKLQRIEHITNKNCNITDILRRERTKSVYFLLFTPGIIFQNEKHVLLRPTQTGSKQEESSSWLKSSFSLLEMFIVQKWNAVNHLERSNAVKDISTTNCWYYHLFCPDIISNHRIKDGNLKIRDVVIGIACLFGFW